jgi:hypothetical protein
VESLGKAFGHGFAVASKIGYHMFQNVILNALFIFDEEHLEMAIDQDVDFLALLMIYAPQWAKYSRELVGRFGQGYETKITLASSLKFLDEQCQRRHRRYYDVIVNLPKTEATDPPATLPTVTSTPDGKPPEKVYPPPRADQKRLDWWDKNMTKLTCYVFRGEVPESTRQWAIAHLKWRAQQMKEGKKDFNELMKQGIQEAQAAQAAKKEV